MAKVTTNISVRGVDLKDMLKEAHAQLSDLTDAPFTVTQVDLWPGAEDVAMKEGMARMPSWTTGANRLKNCPWATLRPKKLRHRRTTACARFEGRPDPEWRHRWREFYVRARDTGEARRQTRILSSS